MKKISKARWMGYDVTYAEAKVQTEFQHDWDMLRGMQSHLVVRPIGYCKDRYEMVEPVRLLLYVDKLVHRLLVYLAYLYLHISRSSIR